VKENDELEWRGKEIVEAYFPSFGEMDRNLRSALLWIRFQPTSS